MLLGPVGDELLRRPVAERTVRSLGVVFDASSFNHAASVREAEEPVLIEALVAEFAVEALDVRGSPFYSLNPDATRRRWRVVRSRPVSSVR
jgi:hypothetical protein